MIIEKKDGKSIRYSLNTNFNNTQEIVSLLKTHYKSIWNNWANRLAEMFLLLSNDDDDGKV